jgi:hypothetical protein
MTGGRWVAAAVFVAGVTAAGSGLRAQATLDLTKPEDALKASRRVQCSLEDGKAVTFSWRGGVMSRMPGEQDRHIFNVEGMNIRQCGTVTDPKRGTGYRLVSREILLYLDPKTNQLLTTWNNPWTNQTNEVVHVANDPVNQPPTFSWSTSGEPYRWTGRNMKGKIWQSFEVPLFYENALGGEYQDFVGGQYQAVEAFDFFMDEADLVNPARDMQSVTIAWARISQWLPWMNMGDRPGALVFTTVGKRLNDPNNLPDLMKNAVKTMYPAYTAPPPLDDRRPNETSWTAYKKHLDRKKASAPKTQEQKR